MGKTRAIGCIGALGLTGALVFALSASGARKSAGTNGACYGQNEFMVNPGNVTAASSGQHFRVDTEWETPGKPTRNGSADLTYSFSASAPKNTTGAPFAVTATSMTGRLTLDIAGRNGVVTHFESRCIAELGANPSKSQDSLGDFEAELEGTVTNFFGISGPRQAVASISVDQSSGIDGTPRGSLKVHVGIELGSTCNEGATEADETELGASNTADEGNFGSFSALGSGSRANLPVGVTPGFNPCQNVFL